MFTRYAKVFLLVFSLINSVSTVRAQIPEDTLFSPGGFSINELRMHTDLISDANGKLWVSYRTLGVLYYDGQTWVQFNAANTANQLPSDEVHCLFRENTGVLWIANRQSLTRKDQNGFKNYFFSTSFNIPTNPIKDITQSQSKIFLATQSGLLVLDTVNSVWQTYNSQNSSLLNDTINSLITDPSGVVWMGTQSGYAKYYQNSLTSFPFVISGSTQLAVQSMAVTVNDTLLAGGDDILYRKNGNSFLNLDSVYFGYPTTDHWCDTLSFGKLTWNGKSKKFTTKFCISPVGDIMVQRSFGYLNDIYVMSASGQLSYSYAYNSAPLFAVAGFFKSDTIVIAAGLANVHFRLFETPQSGHYTDLEYQSPFHAPYDIDFTIPPSHVAGPMDTLQGNMIRSMILNRGDWAWDPVGVKPLYEVPRGSSLNSVYAASIWMGGYDQGGNLYTAAMTYRQNNASDFHPGPLDTTGHADSVTVATFNHIWMTRRSDVDEFRYQFAMGNVQNGTYTVPSYILNWPDFYNAPAYPQNLAPFVDVNADGEYNPMDGDYPDVKGDQMSWCVFNDDMNKSETNSAPMNVEVHSAASVYQCHYAQDALNRILSYTTFYHFDVFNRGGIDFDSCYFGIWTDPDLGNASDDYVGCNLSANSFFVYNGDSVDEGQGGFGICAPTQSFSILAGPEAPAGDGLDNDHNGLVDESNEELGLSGFTYYLSVNNMPTGNPSQKDHYYNYLSGSWLDGIPITYGGDGRGSGIGATLIPTKFMWPDSSDLNFTTPWNMQIANFQPDDMRGVGTVGPFNLNAGESKSFDVAFITGPNDLIQNHELVRELRNYFRSGALTNRTGILPAIQGPGQVAASGSSVIYLLPYAAPGIQYLWTVTNGLIISGQGTNSISVTWGTTGSGEVKVEVLDPANPCELSGKLAVAVGSQSIDQSENQYTVRIFPNPVRHQLQIESPDVKIVTVHLRSSTGQLLMSQSYNGTCDVSTLAPGMYFLELKDETGAVQIRKMFMKQ